MNTEKSTASFFVPAVATFVGSECARKCLKQFSIADGKPDKLLGLQARLKSLRNTTYSLRDAQTFETCVSRLDMLK